MTKEIKIQVEGLTPIDIANKKAMHENLNALKPEYQEMLAKIIKEPKALEGLHTNFNMLKSYIGL